MTISERPGSEPEKWANAEQAAVWDGAAAERRIKKSDQSELEARRHNEVFRAATGIAPGDRVLDIGCGTGQSTRDAARAAVRGSVLGVDLSARMLEHARRLAAEEGLDNVAFEPADAQVHPFPADHFDVGISRFGVMFFADPVAAFTNIGRALRSGGRLALMVWQDRDRNEWVTAIRRSIDPAGTLPPLLSGTRHPFSLGDPDTVESILDAAGFVGVGLADVHEPVHYGANAAAAYDFVRSFASVSDTLAELDAAAAERATDRLRDTLAAHETERGVLFDSRAWIVTAHRR